LDAGPPELQQDVSKITQARMPWRTHAHSECARGSLMPRLDERAQRRQGGGPTSVVIPVETNRQPDGKRTIFRDLDHGRGQSDQPPR